MKKAKCYDCGMSYGGDDWIDTVLPNAQWDRIFPEHNGFLCANCIVKRASKISGVIILKATLWFADDYR